MDERRLDTLLEEALATGRVPADATAEEFAEIQALLRSAGMLQRSQASVEAEARASMPLARARFQRFLGAERAAGASTPAPVEPRRRYFGRLFAGRGVLALGGSAAVVAVALLAVVVALRAFSTPTTAYALNPGDYAQLEGVVVGSAGGNSVRLQSELGELEVEVSETTSVVDAQSQELATLSPGDRVVVSGIVGEDRKRIAAQTLAVAARHEGAPLKRVSIKQLERLRPQLEGRIVTFTIAAGGDRGAVVIDAGNGQRFLVQVDGRSAEELLARAATALGQRVRVVKQSEVTAGTFTLVVPGGTTAGTPTPSSEPPRQGQADRPGLVGVKGTILGVRWRPSTAAGQHVEGVVTIQTNRGPVTVIVRATTRILPGDSGFRPGDGLRGEAEGYGISVSGGLDRATGNIIADVIVLHPRPAK